ncbi:MAG: type VI secretion system membrane subunit TssM [Pseudomonadota bacterium]
MKAVLRLLFSRPVLIALGLALVGLVIWHVGKSWPIFQAEDDTYYRPLAGVWPRVLAIASLYVLWGLIVLVRHLVRVINAARLKKALAVEENQVDSQVAQIERAFGAAVAGLERDNRGALTTLPWYVVLGPSDAGKTELLRTSGLEFPYERANDQQGIGGSRGTRNCKWWLGREAVLLDTAGRYVKQDQHREADQAEWQRFLTLLRRYRKRQPINGILAVISAEDILGTYQHDKLAMSEEATLLRARVSELRSAFGVDLPVYLVINKMDLVAGFTEYFRDLNCTDQRAQVWGFDVADAVQVDRQQLHKHLADGFRGLTHRLRQRGLHRLYQERELHYAVPVQAFPWQLDHLSRCVTEFTEQALGPDSNGDRAWLRGVYLTSATQTGAPIDQLTTELSQLFGIAEVEQSSAGGEGRSYFVRDLLREKVFAERELVGESPHRRFLKRFALRASIAASVVAVVVSSLVWLLGFRASTQALSEAEALRAQAQELLPTGAEPSELLDFLGAVQALRASDRARLEATDPTRALGISLAPHLERLSSDLYQDASANYFVPYLAAWLYDSLSQRPDGASLALAPTSPWRSTYEEFVLLEYLAAFSDRERLNDSARKEELLAWFAAVFDAEFANDGELLQELLAHLGYYDGPQAQPLPQTPFEGSAVLASRERFADRDPARLTYELLRGATEGAVGRETDLRNAPNPLIFAQVFGWDGADTPALVIPGLFTRTGLEALLEEENQLLTFVDDHSSREWVFGEGYRLPSKRELKVRLTQMYVADYLAVWERALNVLRVRRSPEDRQRSVITAYVGPNSPVRKLLEKVYGQTRLALPEEPKAGGGGVGKAAGRLANRTRIGRTIGRLGVGSGVGANEATPREQITEHFSSLNGLMEGTVTQLDALLRETANVLRVYDDVDQRQRVVSDLNVIAEQQPAPVNGWTRALVTSSASAVADAQRQEQAVALSEARVAAEDEVRAGYLADVWPFCSQAANGRFPMTASSGEDISLDDFARLFGDGGVLDAFTSSILGPYLDRTVRPWRWRTTEEVQALRLPIALAQAMQQASAIRRTYYDLPLNLGLRLTAADVDPRINTVRIELDGQPVRYQRGGPTRSVGIEWPRSEASGFTLQLTTTDDQRLVRRWDGPWALLRALQDARVVAGPGRGVVAATFEIDGYSVGVSLDAQRAVNPLVNDQLTGFRCPAL